MKKLICLLVGALIIAAAGCPDAVAEVVGKVTRLQGEASRAPIAAAAPLGLRLDAPIDMYDVVTTGADGRLELTLGDGTRVTLGGNARLVVDEYVYQPGTTLGRVSMTVSGAFRYVSGVTAKGAVERTVITPAATIGIRGTDFWGGPRNGLFGVVLFEGEISVDSGGGAVTISAGGFGTEVIPGALRAPGAPPVAPVTPTAWSQPDIDQAIEMVSFR